MSVAGGRRASLVAAWLVPIALAVAALQAAAGPMPSPPLLHPSAWSAWADGRDPVVVAFTLLRVLALGAAWYCLGVVVVGIAVRLVAAGQRGPNAVTGQRGPNGVTGLAAAVDRVTLPPLRRLVAATVGISLSTGALGATAALARPAAVVATTTTTTTMPAPPGTATVTMHLLAPGAAPATPPQSPPAPAPPSAVPAVAPAARAPSATWIVQPGECFWSIADGVLADAWGRRPAAAEVVPYWRRLIEANRSALADPANPDLIFPGQVFTVPEVAPG